MLSYRLVGAILKFEDVDIVLLKARLPRHTRGSHQVQESGFIAMSNYVNFLTKR